MTPPLCSILEWDSAFFGCPVARLNERHVNAKSLAEVFEWCTAHRVRCLYYLAPAEDVPSLLAAQAAGMQFIDVRMTLTRDLEPEQTWAVAATISPATAADRSALLALAPHLAQVSRFSADPHFGTEAALRLYEAWLTKQAHAVLVARMLEDPERIGGAVMCNIAPDGAGVIDLLAVTLESRGQGLALDLCHAALHWFADRGCSQVRVVTQGHNVASQRAYQRAGFVTQSVEIWFHKWFDG